MIRNPITEDEYHIYEYRKKELTFPNQASAGATGLVNFMNQQWIEEFDVDLNMVKQDFAAYASTYPDNNSIWFTYWVDVAPASQGYTFNVSFISDIEFADVQDDGLL